MWEFIQGGCDLPTVDTCGTQAELLIHLAHVDHTGLNSDYNSL